MLVGYERFDSEVDRLFQEMKEYIESFKETVWFTETPFIDSYPDTILVGWENGLVVCDTDGTRADLDLSQLDVYDLLFIIGELEC